MGIEEKIKNRITELINSGRQLRYGRGDGWVRDEVQRQNCIGWLVSAQNLVHLVVNDHGNPYRSSTDRICGNDRGNVAPQAVGEVHAILELLLVDMNLGLLVSIENRVRATAFDAFLDHAKEYAMAGYKNQAGVIAGVVFEDTARTICRNTGIEENGIQLDTLINGLVRAGILTQVQSKRAKAAADVRTRATHADWEKFELEDVKATIEFTEELIRKNLDG